MKDKKKIKVEKCPNCKDVEMIKIKSGKKGEAEIFKCKNCKFVKEK